jgi:hypothetical protein
MSAKYNNKYSKEIYRLIEPLLGDIMTQNIIKLQSKKIGKTEETLVASDLPNLAEAIRMGLSIFIGSEASGRIAASVSKIV